MICVAVVESQPLVQAALRRALTRRAGFEISLEVPSAAALAEREGSYAVVLLGDDAAANAQESVETALAGMHRAPVLVMVDPRRLGETPDLLRAGAAGVVRADAPVRDLHRALREVAAGRCWVDPGALRELLELARLYLPSARPPAEFAQLTARERAVFELISTGASNAEIAAKLGVTIGTVKAHVGRVLAKLGLRDRAAAVVFAFDRGLARRA